MPSLRIQKFCVFSKSIGPTPHCSAAHINSTHQVCSLLEILSSISNSTTIPSLKQRPVCDPHREASTTWLWW